MDMVGNSNVADFRHCQKARSVCLLNRTISIREDGPGKLYFFMLRLNSKSMRKNRL